MMCPLKQFLSPEPWLKNNLVWKSIKISYFDSLQANSVIWIYCRLQKIRNRKIKAMLEYSLLLKPATQWMGPVIRTLHPPLLLPAVKSWIIWSYYYAFMALNFNAGRQEYVSNDIISRNRFKSELQARHI